MQRMPELALRAWNVSCFSKQLMCLVILPAGAGGGSEKRWFKGKRNLA